MGPRWPRSPSCERHQNRAGQPGSRGQGSAAEQAVKSKQRKGRCDLALFANNMIVYPENPKKSTRKQNEEKTITTRTSK